MLRKRISKLLDPGAQDARGKHLLDITSAFGRRADILRGIKKETAMATEVNQVQHVTTQALRIKTLEKENEDLTAKLLEANVEIHRMAKILEHQLRDDSLLDEGDEL